MRRKTLLILLFFTAVPLLQLSNGCSFDSPGIGPVPPEESNPNSYVCACDCGPEARTRSLRVAFGNDDVEEVVAGGAIERASADLDLIDTRIVGLRFRNVGIPAGAVIQDARVQFSAPQDDLGNVSVTLRGEAALDAAPFGTTPGDLSGRVLTTASVPWIVPPWTAGSTGAAQLTPDLSAVLQEIVDQPGWVDTSSVALLVFHTSGGGRRHAISFDARADLAPQLIVTYQDPGSPLASHEIPACMLAEHNANVGGTSPDAAALEADCTGRVQDTLSGLAGACGYPAACNCALVPDSERFAQTCDDTCSEVAVDADCTNFDPVGGSTEATNAPGDAPVCVANSPLAHALFGRRTTCDVTGEVLIDVDDESVSPAAGGIVEFLGFCPGQSCPVAMEYRLDLENVTVGNIFGSATFVDLASLGKSLPGEEALLSPAGEGSFAPDSTDSSARGRRGSDQRALASTNQDFIDVTATFGAPLPTCSVAGALVGAADPELKRCEGFGPSADLECETDDQCEDVAECTDEVCNCEAIGDVDMTMQLFLTGDIVNQPPTAAAADQTVECNQPTGARLTLDGSASSDFENDIALYSWRHGSRTGAEVGFEPTADVEQAVGVQSYVLRVIDTFGQTDETTAEVTVEDTTPPAISCNANPTVTPPEIPISYTATAEDVCDPDLEPQITAYDCYAFTSKGKKVDKTTSCKVSFAGDTVTIAHSGGVGTIITWDVVVTDDGGNTTEHTCQVLAVRQ